MAESVAELRAWAAEIARNKDVYPTWKEDCRAAQLLDLFAKALNLFRCLVQHNYKRGPQ